MARGRRVKLMDIPKPIDLGDCTTQMLPHRLKSNQLFKVLAEESTCVITRQLTVEQWIAELRDDNNQAD